MGGTAMKTQKILITTIITALLCGCSNNGTSANYGSDYFSSPSTSSSSNLTNDDSYNPQKEKYDNISDYEELPFDVITEGSVIRPSAKYDNVLGRNVRFNSNMDTIDVVEEEHNIFRDPELYAHLNKVNETIGCGSNRHFIKGDSMSEIVYGFLDTFRIDEGMNHISSQCSDIDCFRRIKALSLQRHLYSMFSHSISKIDENDNMTYFVGTENLGCATYFIRENPNWYAEAKYFTAEYIDDVETILAVDNYETYSAFFDLYGIGLAYSYTFWFNDTTYLSFHCKNGVKAYDIFKNYELITRDGLEKALNENQNIMLGDYCIDSAKDDEMRLVNYSIFPISLMVPHDKNYTENRKKVHAALVQYITEKCDALEKEIEEIDNGLRYAKEVIEVMNKDSETKDHKVWRYTSNLIEDNTNYNPKVLKSKNLRRLLVRPCITLADGHKKVVANCNISLGGKNALLIDQKTMETSTNTIKGNCSQFELYQIINANGDIEFNVWFDEPITPEKIELEFYYN